MFFWLFILFASLFYANANNIIGNPIVKCNPEEIVIEAKSADKFEGIVFIKNWRQVGVCASDFLPSINATKEPVFKISLKDISKCGLELQKTSQGNLEIFFVLIYGFHSNFMTAEDRAFTIQCIYPPQSIISFQLDEIPDITTKATLSSSIQAPPILFKVVTGDVPNEQLNSVQSVLVGDPISLTWYFDDNSDVYGFQILECTASGQPIIINGCSTDPNLISNVQYVDNHRKAYSNTTAFKLPDAENLWIKCKLELCLKPHENLQDCKQRQKKRSIDFNEDVIVLNNKIVVLDSYKNKIDSEHFEEQNLLLQTTPVKNEWCITKSVFSTIVAFIGTIYMTAIISILALYKITRRRLEYK
ncbi:ZP domain-containing protein [Aphelenchoides bicaudatus]|nr:ZP domain-containing protein [Aphelenchoides bicaudatus]